MQGPATDPHLASQEPADADFDPLESADAGFAATVRPHHWLHAVYAVVVVILIVTGLPIQFPDLRAKLLGGYGRMLAAIHEWTGVGMVVVPMTAFFWGTGTVVETIRIRSYRREYLRFHAVNLWFTLVSGLVFVVTGFVLWFQDRLPDGLVDASMELHLLFSYALYVLIPLHIFTARKRIFEATLRWWRVGRTSPRRYTSAIAARAKGRI